MKTARISLIAALIAAVLGAYLPVASAQDDTKPAKPAQKRETRPGRPGGGGGPGGPEAMMKERMNRLTEELSLTDAQKPKVEAALKAQMEAIRGVRTDSNLSDEQKREKARTAREDFNKKMKEILTAEQYAKFEKMPPGRGPGGPGGPGGERKAKKAEKS